MKRSELGQLIPEDVQGVNWDVKEVPADTEYVDQNLICCALLEHLKSCARCSKSA